MEVIQFHCPACQTQLRVPPAAAGFKGPCPACRRDIVGPIPDHGLEARLATQDAFSPFPGNLQPGKLGEPLQAPEPILPTAPEELEPFAPFSDPPPADVPVSAPQPVTPASALPEPPTPAPSPTEAAECLAPKQFRRLRTAVLLLSCLLCSLISFIAGYLLALRSQVFPAPIFADSPAFLPPSIEAVAQPPVQPPPHEEPVEPESPTEAVSTREDVDLTGSPTDPQPRPAAQATLEAFLSAPDWASRMAYVLDPEEVRSSMKKSAEESGDGPIEATSIKSAYVFPDQEHFTVKTEAIPAGFPVTLQRQGGDWRIDWEIFDEFHGDRFRRFASGKLGETEELHVYLKPHASEDPNGFARYQLSAPIEGRSYPAFSKRGQLAQAKISSLLDSDSVKENAALQKLLANDGIPVVLKLSYQSRGQNQNFLLIEDLVAQGWGR